MGKDGHGFYWEEHWEKRIRHKQAEECILKGIKIDEELKIKTYYAPGYYFLGELYADTGQKDKALETLKKAEKLFREMGMDYWLVKTREVLERL
jgi:tetratricopeptide (TPR) repeat protein